MAGELAIAFSVSVRVYFRDTDAGAVVYHGTYLDYLERARTEWLRSLGFDQRALMHEHGVVFIVRALQVDYLRPAVLEDVLQVSAALRDLGRVQLTLDQQVRRGTEPLVRASVNLACVSAGQLRPMPIPPPLRAALSAAGGAGEHSRFAARERH
ncbi:MAG TPA: tol-pal system-associated acyl-CoA thioesterase [Burkholderiales bacterium]|nr:tol-pal system-associated acyl-CoA thioesterase [Burkholderiales bacterium]